MDFIAASSSEGVTAASLPLSLEHAINVQYCPHCSMPPEYCEFGPCFNSKCLPWIQANCPSLYTEERLAQLLAAASVAAEVAATTAAETGGAAPEEAPKKKGGKKSAEPRVVIAKIQRQKRKFVTAIAGLESVPDVKLKDVTKVLGKKFSSGASISDTPSGAKEIVIQGDFVLELPELLINEFHVPSTAIYIIEDGQTRPFA